MFRAAFATAALSAGASVIERAEGVGGLTGAATFDAATGIDARRAFSRAGMFGCRDRAVSSPLGNCTTFTGLDFGEESRFSARLVWSTVAGFCGVPTRTRGPVVHVGSDRGDTTCGVAARGTGTL